MTEILLLYYYMCINRPVEEFEYVSNYLIALYINYANADKKKTSRFILSCVYNET